MGGLLRPEFLIIVVVALLIFGPKKLPEMGSSIGKTIREFQKSMREVKEPEQSSAAVPPVASTPTAQIGAPAAASSVETPAPTAAAPAASAATPAPTSPAATTPSADPLPPVGTTVE